MGQCLGRSSANKPDIALSPIKCTEAKVLNANLGTCRSSSSSSSSSSSNSSLEKEEGEVQPSVDNDYTVDDADEDESQDGDAEEDEGRGSILPGNKIVTRRQMKWVRNEQGSLGRSTKISLEDHFRALLADFRGTSSAPGGGEGDRMPRAALLKYFKRDGASLDLELFDKVFKLFDADSDGEISKEEFTVAFGFITYRGSAKDLVELAFFLFDTNRDGQLSRREYNDMISCLVGMKLENLLKIEGGQSAIESFLKKEHSDELLSFLEACKFFREEQVGPRRNHRTLLTVIEASEIFETYLEVDSPMQVNVSATMREKCRHQIERVNKKNTLKHVTSLSLVFDEAAREVLHILEAGPLMRFKVALRQGKIPEFADAAWAIAGADDTVKTMSLDDFRHWADASPQTMSLFTELTQLLDAATMQLFNKSNAAA